MYSLNCPYYTKSFKTLNELIDAVLLGGMDPNYEVMKDGVGMGQDLIEFILP